jgi:alpha-glucosidase
MREDSSSVCKPVARLAVAQISGQSLELRSKNGLIEITVLAPDLFRVRMTAAKKFSGRPSWAVCKTDWPCVPTRIRASRNLARIETEQGRLIVGMTSGEWTLVSKTDDVIFSSVPQKTGFAKGAGNVTLALDEGESLFGLGETTGTFNKRGLIREFWNTDVLGHASAIHPGLRSLYVSIPFAISLRNGRAAGLFWDNPARQTWDLGQTKLFEWQMRAASGEVDLYLFLGPRVSDVTARYTELTGRIPLPPRWALGYQQCRYSYETRARVEEIARELRRRKIPCDAIYLDIHHLRGYRVFTFGKTFPQPAQMISKLARQGFKVVTIVDPGVKNDPKFGVLKRGLAAKAFVKAPGGKKDYLGKVWPGKSRFPDFLNAHTREWWGREQSEVQRLGVAGFWNDMNEPANFALPTKTLPENSIHHSDFGLMKHAEAHNLYGMQMARASREGALAHAPNQRPFVITRAGYAGVQRHAMVWTGDNSSVWEHLADSVQMYLNLSVSGLAFCGGDVGGFLDNVTPELLARWTQMAAFVPFFRNHSNIGTIDQEPWAFGLRVEAICRRHIELRYQLLPYFYSLFAEAHRVGTPIMRPLFWHHQNDPVAVATGDQFLLGADLLVAPVLQQGVVARSVYLPRGEWFNFWTGGRFAGGQHIVAPAPLETIPLFVRAGAIIPMSAVQQFVGENESGVVNLHIWPGPRGELNWYEDDGETMAYASGKIHERRVVFHAARDGHGLTFEKPRGAFLSKVKTWRVILRGAECASRIFVNGKKVAGRFDREACLVAFAFPNVPGAITVQFS